MNHLTNQTTGEGDEEATLRQILADEARSAAASHLEDHPDDEDLAAYLDESGAVPDEREEEIRAHLLACRDCIERLLALDLLATPDAPPADDQPVDFARAAAWRAFDRERRRLGSAPRRTFGLVAASLLAVLALAYVLAPGFGTAPEPAFQDNVAIHYLDELTRSRSFETSEIVVDEDAAYWTLILTPPIDAERYPSYVLEYYWDGELRYRGRLEPSELGTLSQGVPTDRVPAGDVRLVLKGVRTGEPNGEAEEVLIEEYPLRVVYH